MPDALRAALAAAVLGSGLIAGCSPGSAPPAPLAPAGPVTAPRGGPAADGTVTPLGAAATGMVLDPRTRTTVVALTAPPRLALVTPLAAPGAGTAREIPLPGPAADLVLAGDAVLVPVRSPGALLRVPLDGGPPARIALDGTPRSVAVVGGRTVVSLGNRLQVIENGRPVRTVTSDFVDVTRLVAYGPKVAVLDGARSALTVVDPASGDVGAALRVGNGATDIVTDRFGRLLATDVRDGEFLALSGDPLLLRQRFPLAGGPYAVAYDSRRDLAWVSLTARDKVVGLDVAGGEPVVVHRFATVHQPDSVAVDPESGRVLVASASGAGLQVIDPKRVVQ